MKVVENYRWICRMNGLYKFVVGLKSLNDDKTGDSFEYCGSNRVGWKGGGTQREKRCHK